MSLPISIYKTESTTDALAPRADGVAVSGTSTYYSDVWSCNDVSKTTVALLYTGTMTGAATFWGSNSPRPDLTNDNDWHQITVTVTDPAGAATKTTFDSTNGLFWKRIKYVNASGSGTVKGYVNSIRS